MKIKEHITNFCAKFILNNLTIFFQGFQHILLHANQATKLTTDSQ